ncbi:MAG: 50S ribosomal protein L6 [Deltaproteobacteria bacterium]|nr:50S ribosomal protein L6 [Deltaproteobacteria bacterium]MBW2594987.1 50S ribosomal protein L6 [Deltaproteobacteria bacterium]
MSRIGKRPIEIPDGVRIRQDGSLMVTEGPRGTLSRKIPEGIAVALEGDVALVNTRSDDRRGRSLHGLARTLIANMVTGVSKGFEKSLEIVGVGYRGEVTGNVLKLLIGYSDPVEYKIPEGITIKVDKQVNMVVSGIDKELVGRTASEIRDLKKPEPYKGKGIRYAGEYVRKKVGKSAGT